MAAYTIKNDLDLVRQIVLGRLKSYNVRVYLFGSRAAGKARRLSDIDVAVLPLQPVPRYIFSEIRETLEESDVLYPVDLVDLSEADEKIRQRVLKEGILWTE